MSTIKTLLVIMFTVILPLEVLADARYSNEVRYLTGEFRQDVGEISVDAEYKQKIFSLVQIAMKANPVIKSSQYVFLADRNPSMQIGMLLFVDSFQNKLIFIGATKISTGNPDRRGYFITPLGFHKNSTANGSYRALGTKNSKGWRGLGVKNSRVWDFGWVWTVNKNTKTKKIEPYQIRLLLHATDPDHGEPRLGTVDSKGCIRISAKLNRFLDYFGILDAEYELSEKMVYVLLKEREPVNFAGKFVLVVDSRDSIKWGIISGAF